MERKIVAVIGAGASGLTAAIECARLIGGENVVLLEKQKRPGRKLLATGSGRCNITNSNISAGRYHGDEAVIRSVLSDFTAQDMSEFLASLGVLIREDDEGRCYPYSNQASTILDSMLKALKSLGVSTVLGFAVEALKRERGGFRISGGDKCITAENVILATGSCASPMLGADGSGYRLLRELGIESTTLFPALCPIETEEDCSILKGVRSKGTVTLTADGRKLRSSSGEIQFTGQGISGICVFEQSRAVGEFLSSGSVNGTPCREVRLSLDVMSAYSFPELCLYLNECRKIFGNEEASSILCGALNPRLSQYITGACRLSGKQCATLTQQDIKRIANAVKGLTFTPKPVLSFKNAQVSAGGISSGCVDPHTLSAHKYNNLYVCGELLDADGDCGGFNLHFAFGSGLRAARMLAVKRKAE